MIKFKLHLNQLFKSKYGDRKSVSFKDDQLKTMYNIKSKLLDQIKPEISDRVQDQVQCPRSDESTVNYQF